MERCFQTPRKCTTCHDKCIEKTPPVYVPIAYRHEVYVLDLIENKSMFQTRESISNLDMSNYESEYDDQFWKSLSMPPETKFIEKI